MNLSKIFCKEDTANEITDFSVYGSQKQIFFEDYRKKSY